MRSSCALAVVVLVGLALVPSVARAGSSAISPAPVDVLLAIDGTASMKPSIAQAKQDGERLVAGLRQVHSDVRVGVVVFRDYRNPAGEYELLQAPTDDLAAVDAALEKVRPVGNPDPENGVAESYSLLFRKSYTDPQLAWRAGAMKVVVVIGDAEPYGAGEGGLDGCRSDVRDPHGLDPAKELAAMKANRIAVLMVRQVSAETTSTLGCYEAIAQQAYVGSAARDGGGRADLVEPIVTLIRQVFVPLSLRVSSPTLARGAKTRLTLTLTNRSSAPLTVSWLRVSLPRGVRYEGASTAGPPKRRLTSQASLLVWHMKRTLAPGGTANIRFAARPTRAGTYSVTARGLATLASGLKIELGTRAPRLTAWR